MLFGNKLLQKYLTPQQHRSFRRKVKHRFLKTKFQVLHKLLIRCGVTSCRQNEYSGWSAELLHLAVMTSSAGLWVNWSVWNEVTERSKIL